MRVDVIIVVMLQVTYVMWPAVDVHLHQQGISSTIKHGTAHREYCAVL